MIRNWNIADDADIESKKLRDGYVLSKALQIKPPLGAFRVTNLYVDPITKKLVVEYDDEPVT